MLDINKTIIRSIIAVSCLFVMLIVVVAGFFTFGWFSSNKKVDTTGMQVKPIADQLDVSYFVEIDGEEYKELNLTDFASNITIPGTEARFFISFKNSFESKNSFSISRIGFNAPIIGLDEVPIYIDGKAYYFGTQIEVSVKSAKIYNNSTDTFIDVNIPTDPTDENYVAPVKLLELDNKGNPISKKINIPVNSTFYKDNHNPGTILNYGDYITLEVCVSFINLDEPQDEYQNFGVEQGKCQRSLYIEYSPIE